MKNFKQYLEETGSVGVWNQTPVFGEKVFKDEGIKLFVSKGEFAPELYDVPILIDLNLEEAIKIINKV